ncbi:MAG: cadherin domain-containing protein [Pleurocapsa sp. MO_226.B13]|nr:cadherin domain-containing protein [Pleurocapsa sp. MO_226.B13]
MHEFIGDRLEKINILAVDGNGNFVIVWESYGQDGDNGGIYAQRFEVNNAPTITSSNTVEENQTTAIDVDASDDSDSEGNGLTYSLSGGADVSLFNIDADTGVVSFIDPPDFESPSDADGDNIYEFGVTVTDSGGLSDVQDITVTVTDVVENTSPTVSLDATATILENGLATLTGTITDPDVSDTFTLDIDWGDPLSPNNTETFNFDSSSTGSQNFSLEHQYLDDNPSDTASDTYTIQATVSDNNQETGEDTEELTVNNVAPSFGELTVTSVFMDDDDDDDDDDGNDDEEGLSITIEGTFTDPGSLDLHNGTATWSDGFSGGFEDIAPGDRSFSITRFLSEDQLEDDFPEIDDDLVRIGVDISLFDDDLGTDTTIFEFEVSTDD